jgi:hypothetical protein
MYMWKCHNETPCIAILNKQKCLFLKNREQEGKTVPVWVLVPVCLGDNIRKRYRKVNVVEILCTCV